MVMLTWNQREMTLVGLASVLALEYPNLRVVLVDNGSSDGTIDAVRARYPTVTCLPMPTNLGFCAANNRGAEWLRQHLDPDYLLFVNNDIEVAPTMLSRLVEFMQDHPQCGATGPLTYYHEAPQTIWGAGGRIYADLCWFPPIMRDRPDPGLHRPRQVDWVHGCALMVRKEVVERVGLFDERFFIYHDEVDWCLRMKRAGFEVWLIPEAKMWHKVTQAVGLHSPMMIYYTARNKLLFWWKHGHVADLGKFSAFHLVKALRIFSRQRSLWAVVSLLKALGDAVRGGFGKGHIERARK